MSKEGFLNRGVVVRAYDWDDLGNVVWKVVVGDDEEFVDLYEDSDPWTILAHAVNSHFEEEVKNG